MSVNDGQPVSAAITNPAFISKNTSDQMPNQLDFIDATPSSGPSIINIQKQQNSFASFIGMAINGIYNLLPSWATTNRGLSTNTIKQRIEAIDTAFDPSTGHYHTGAAGDGPLINALGLSNIPLIGYGLQGTDLVAVTGTSTDVSAQFTGYVPSTGSTIQGVVVNAPYNKIILRNSVDDQAFEDASGNTVYGRLTESVGVWTLSYYSEIAGVETAYTFASSGVRLYFQLLAPVLSATAPIYSPLFYVPSSNATADIITATTTLQGKTQLATVAQDIAAATSAGTANATVANADHTHKIPTNFITPAMQNQMPAHTFKGNNTAAPADEIDLSIAQMVSELGINLKEDLANKAINFTTINDTLYPSVKAVYDKINESLAGLTPYFFYNTASDIGGGYLQMKTQASVAALQTITNLSVANNQLLATFATNSGSPNLTFLPSGLVKVHIHAHQTGGTKASQLYALIYKRVLAGTETLLCTTGNSGVLTGIDADCDFDAVLPTGTILLTTDRIVCKIYALVSGTGSQPDVELNIEDNTSSRLELPTGISPSGSTQSSIQFKDEGSNLGTSGSVDVVDFVGDGVVATRSVNTLTVSVVDNSIVNALIFG